MQRRTASAPHGRFDVDDPYGPQRRTASPPAGQFDVDRRIAGLAARRHGVVAREEVLAQGLSAREIATRVRRGWLHVVHRGVYAVGHPALTWEGQAHAALLAVGRGVALSHRSAGVATRIMADDGGPIDVTVVGRTPRNRPDIRVHTAQRLDVRHVDGLPTTSPVRTLLDLAAHLPLQDMARALAEAQVLRLVTPAALEREMRRSPNHHGTAALRRLLTTTEPTRSELERRLLRVVREAGLPAPAVNARAAGHEVDLLWADHRVIVETDGWAAHHHRAAFERDRSRDAGLHALGYLVLRFTWRQVVDEPLLVATRIAQVLAQRGIASVRAA